ncbi:MAG: thioether cross-link-forming SCIFF peptide maturase [Saccharofermentanales bacterium]|nr:thioether cross-link-forming SCIFF peptide maturase [Clostridiaceae bacterium]
MLHLFSLNGDRLAFDSESGALHSLDETAYAVLSAWVAAGQNPPAARVLQKLADRYGSAVFDCQREILGARDQGLMFAPVAVTKPEQLYPEQPRIKSMCLHLCHDCNLRCRYCFAGTGDFGTGHRSMLSEETGRKAIDFLLTASGDRQNLDIDFFGGEPLLNWPVVTTLVEYCESRAAETGREIRLTITTNAVLLDQGKTDYINRHFKNCVLSIDGRPEVHNRMRQDLGGKGSYDRVADRIRTFVVARGEREHYLRGTFTRENLDFSADVLHLATLSSQVSLEPVVSPPGSGYDIRREDLPVLETEYEKLATIMNRMDEQGRGFNFFHFMIDLKGGPCAFKRLKGCGVGTEYCAVTPEGDIYPCHQFVGQEQFRLGNVHDQPVVLDQDVLKCFQGLLVPNKETCRNCWAKYFCGGGCAANAWHASGSVNGLYEIGCALQKKRLECALWLQAKKIERGGDRS